LQKSPGTSTGTTFIRAAPTAAIATIYYRLLLRAEFRFSFIK